MEKIFRKKILIRLLAFLIISGILVLTAIILWRLHLINSYQEKIFDKVSTTPFHKVGIVLGASAKNSRPSDVLRDRLDSAIKLYKAGKVEKLLLSGDNRVSHYNEPEVMYDYAVKKGVPAEDLVRDYAGRRTYDTCYRAKEIFQVDKALVITTGFHVPRSLYLCEKMGINVQGYNADIMPYLPRYERWWVIRETLATSAAWLDIYIRKPTPILGDPIPIK